MFKNSSIIVVGAGASAEAGLPIGEVLKNEIAGSLSFRMDVTRNTVVNGDPTIHAALSQAYQKLDGTRASSLFGAAKMISESMPMAISIDNYIDALRGNKNVELCAKLAIVQCILSAERECSLWFDYERGIDVFDHKLLSGTWYNSFMQLLTEDCRVGDLGERLSRITFIVFNYDRCVEHYIYHSLRRFYGLDQAEAAQIVDGMTFIHPYGTVGSLEWANGGDVVRFGEQVSPGKLLALSNKIKTFTEGIDPASGHRERIGDAMRGAAMVLYLGFAFHDINLRMLDIEIDGVRRETESRHYATAYGISDGDCKVVREELAFISGTGEERIEIRNSLKCIDLFSEYWRRLSLR